MYLVQEFTRISKVKIGCVFIIREVDVRILRHLSKAVQASEA
jgi:hypothetical protein